MVDKLVEECNENIDEAKLAEIALFEHVNERVCSYSFFCLVCNSLSSQHWGRPLFYL